MSKTKPIGVRFDLDLLAKLKELDLADTPQKVLNFLSEYYIKEPEVIIKNEIFPTIQNPNEEYNNSVVKRIIQVRDESIPPERDKSDLSRNSWKMDQKKIINTLISLLR